MKWKDLIETGQHLFAKTKAANDFKKTHHN